ncbi:MAG: HAD-IA family hydrolase [Aigarchaeota archaeon]|nr:HAD-IA family hydrolase [Candidatus Pelearchaeum maunauluense]
MRKFDDVDRTLNAVKEYGARLIIISNIASEMWLRIYLNRLGIAGYFDYLVASGSVGFEKPDTRVFRHAASLVGVEPQGIMHVGDSYEHDYLGAQAAGFFPVLVDRYGRNMDKNCRKIDKLYELVDFLQEAL